jgi:hypothetical protein
MAKEGWKKVRSFLDGRRLVVERGTGRVLFKERQEIVVEEDEIEITEEWAVGNDDEDGEVDVEVQAVNKEDMCSMESKASQVTAPGFGFLENIGTEDESQDGQEKEHLGKKRRREEERFKPKTEMFGVPG